MTDPSLDPAQIPPELAAQEVLSEAESRKPVAKRIPELRNLALLGIFIMLLFGPVQHLAMASLNKTYGNTNEGIMKQLSHFYTPLNLILLIISMIALVALLKLRNAKLVRYILIAIGINFAYAAIRDLLSFAVIGVVIDGYILWRIYNVYTEVEGIEYKLQV